MIRSELSDEIVFEQLSFDTDKSKKLAHIAHELEVSPSSVLYYLRKLQADGYAYQFDDKTWIATKQYPSRTPRVIRTWILPESEETPEVTVNNAEAPLEPSEETGTCAIDISSLTLSQSYAWLAVINQHIADIYMAQEIAVAEAAANAAQEIAEVIGRKISPETSQEIECCPDAGVTVEVFPLVETGIKYDPDDYKARLGKMGNSIIYTKYIVGLFDMVGMKREFTKEDVYLLFKGIKGDEIYTMDDPIKKTRALKKIKNTVNNLVYSHMMWMKEEGLIDKTNTGWLFVVSPIDKFGIELYW